MNDKQQTAVQWLIEQILVKENTSYFNMRTNDIDLSYYVNKALEMEREQIKKAARWEPFLGDYAKEVGEQYYTDNYKTQDND